MSEGSPVSPSASKPSFQSFWQKTKEAVSTKSLRFVSSYPKEDENDSGKVALAKEKLDRRTQVRRAQAEHRARKSNYVKHLEEEIAKLRSDIQTVDQDVSTLSDENSSIKALLSKLGFETSSLLQADIGQDMCKNLNPAKTTIVTVRHDETVKADRLYISRQNKATSLSQSDIAIDFILALEHPCRTHIPYHSDPPDMEAPEHNHALLASTYYFQSAPQTIYNSSGQLRPTSERLKWEAPSLELEQLRGLSESLGVDEIEITPVQAWFWLMDMYDVEQVMTGIAVGELKKALGAIVTCIMTGAVMLKGEFVHYVEQVLGKPRASPRLGNGREMWA